MEQGFGLLKRKRRNAAVASQEQWAERLRAFLGEGKENASPFHWTSKAVAKVMAKCQAEDHKPQPRAA